MMPLSRLERSPPEIFSLICAHAEHIGRAELASLTLASRTCRNAAAVLFFRGIKVYVRHPQQLKDDAQTCQDQLQQSSNLKHVRKLQIDGDISSPEALARTCKSPHGTNSSTINEQNEWWKPLAQLISCIPTLSEMTYTCPSTFSPCLLKALHQFHPTCRLHLENFNVQSLSRSEGGSHDLAIATSPCLYSTNVSHFPFFSDGSEDYSQEAAMRVVAGLAPNLRELRSIERRPGNSPFLIEALRNPKRPFPGFSWDEANQVSTPGNLELLQLNQYIPREVLEAWSKHTRFAAMRVLEMEGPIDLDAMQFLAAECQFDSLRSLSLVFNPYEQPNPDFCNLVTQFLCNIPPLTSLKLIGKLHRSTLDGVFEQAGPALRRLWLNSYGLDRHIVFTAGEVAHISACCPMLNDLTILVPRTRGNADEVSIYKALGSMSNLQYLELQLDAENHTLEQASEQDVETPNDPSFDGYDQQFVDDNHHYDCRPRNGHARDAFINSALDEALACAIFRTISSTKYPRALPLRLFQVRVIGGHDFGYGFDMECVTRIARCLAHTWLIDRRTSTGSRVEIAVTDLGQTSQGNLERPEELEGFAESIFRRIWPGSGAWYNDWHSLPLAGSSDGALNQSNAVIDISYSERISHPVVQETKPSKQIGFAGMTIRKS